MDYFSSESEEYEPEFKSVNLVRARKTYHCAECCGVILPGDRYERITGRWAGEFETRKTCISCSRLAACEANPDATIEVSR